MNRLNALSIAVEYVSHFSYLLMAMARLKPYLYENDGFLDFSRLKTV